MIYGLRACQVLFCGSEAKVESGGHHHCLFHWMNRPKQPKQPKQYTYKDPEAYPYVARATPRDFKIVVRNRESSYEVRRDLLHRLE